MDELGCLDLLSDFAEVLVPDAVWLEVEGHRASALTNPCLPLRRVSAKDPIPAVLSALKQVFSLHTGEWEALRLALEHRPGILLTDDTAARLAAGNLGVATHGTIGILVRAIRRKQRTKEQVLKVLCSVPSQSTLHLKRALLDAVIAEVQRNA